jgi:cell division transport system permease protein
MSSQRGKIKKKKFLGARFTSTISIALVLFVIGLMGLSGLIAAEISVLLREQFTVTLTLGEKVSAKQAEALVQEIQTAPYARSVRYISSAEALESLTDELGENPEDFLGFNPLDATIELQPDAAHASNDSLRIIEAQLLAHHPREITDIDYNHSLIDMVNVNLRRVGMILCAVAALLLLISVSLINNTIRLSLHADRFLIHTMRLVGATAWFIRRPFVTQGMACGFVASLLALTALGGLLYYGAQQEEAVALVRLIVQPHVLLPLAGGVIAIGLLIPAIAAWRATSHYLRMKADDLYLL